MTSVQHSELFERRPRNPILTVEDLPYPAKAIFNPGAVQIGAETLLLARVQDLQGISRLHVARSLDGVSDWRFDPEPLLVPEPGRHPEERLGCEDPRLTWLAERNAWAVAYTAYSRRGPLVSLATTTDFRSVQRLGPVTPPEDKDAALFPRRLAGRFAMIHRPTPALGSAHMWVSFSPDLLHWGDPTLLMEARAGTGWDSHKIGLGPPPIETPHGWLIVYHGTHLTANGPTYRIGLALLDLEDPTIVLRRSDQPVFGPRESYECDGVGQVVFPSGWVVDEHSDQIRLYYGAADTRIGLAAARLSAVLDYVRSCPSGAVRPS